MKQTSYWFKRRRYGWGWTPASWQGWLTISCYFLACLAIVTGISVAGSEQTSFRLTEAFLGLTFLLTTVSFVKGERPRWSWYEGRTNAKAKANQPSS